jgi:peptidyl-prolyl cis-trans isomerase B (cyclophilin B)
MMLSATLFFSALALTSADTPSLRAEHLYTGINRPIMLDIDAAEDNEMGELSLALMTAEGAVMAGPLAVRAGRIDLADLLPQIWELRRACYLQLLENGTPVGSALVVQPLMSRPPIWIERATRPDGVTRYTRIVGWGNDPPPGWEPPLTPEERQAIERATGHDARDEEAQDEEGAPPAVPPAAQDENRPEPEPELCSGLRIYPEQDVIIETSEGDIRIALKPDEAPNTAWNFLGLAEGGFYRDVIFHRIVPIERNGWPFVIQAGDPTSGGSGGPGYWLPIEPSGLPHDFGVISMARADDPDSAGSQFFICLSREGTARLDGQYCAFGYAVEGADVIQKIAATQIADLATGRPADPPVIRAARPVPAPPRTPDVGRGDQRVQPVAPETPTNPGRVPR